MKKLAIGLLGLGVCLLSVQGCVLSHKVTNLERQQLRIEQEYRAVLAENEKLVRMNNQTLLLLTQGGWHGIDSISASSTDN